jgi:hypothetical protein
MRGLSEAEAAACPAAARDVLARYLAGEVSAEIALMHLLLAAASLPIDCRRSRCSMFWKSLFPPKLSW